MAGRQGWGSTGRCLAVVWASDQLDGVTGAFFLAATNRQFCHLLSGSVTPSILSLNSLLLKSAESISVVSERI